METVCIKPVDQTRDQTSSMMATPAIVSNRPAQQYDSYGPVEGTAQGEKLTPANHWRRPCPLACY